MQGLEEGTAGVNYYPLSVKDPERCTQCLKDHHHHSSSCASVISLNPCKCPSGDGNFALMAKPDNSQESRPAESTQRNGDKLSGDTQY